MGKVLGVDFGLKRIGFAIGNPFLGIATPIAPLIRQNSKQVIAHIQLLLTDYDITTIVIGYPLHMDGSSCPMTEQVEHFTRRLKKTLAPFAAIEFVDERLSSFEADETLKTLHSQPKKRKVGLDSMSAVVLLQRYMETTFPHHPREDYFDEDGDNHE